MIKEKTYMINQIHVKLVWFEKNIILIKNVQKLMGQKMLKNPMKKKVLYNISKDQNWKSG
jgi:hypothetical protein